MYYSNFKPTDESKKQKIGWSDAANTINIWLREDENISKHFKLDNGIELLEGKINYAQNSFLRWKIKNREYFGKNGVNELLKQWGFKQKVLEDERLLDVLPDMSSEMI